MRLIWISAMLALTACNSGGQGSDTPAAANAGTASRLPTVPLVVTRQDGNRITLSPELAVTPDQQTRGLSKRPTMGANGAMLFPMVPPRTASFWMKDTLIPLDLLFVRTDGSIAFIAPGKPGDLTPISAGIPVAGVLELPGGKAAALGLAVGDRVQWGQCAVKTAASASAAAHEFCPAE